MTATYTHNISRTAPKHFDTPGREWKIASLYGRADNPDDVNLGRVDDKPAGYYGPTTPADWLDYTWANFNYDGGARWDSYEAAYQVAANCRPHRDGAIVTVQPYCPSAATNEDDYAEGEIAAQMAWAAMTPAEQRAEDARKGAMFLAANNLTR